MKHVRQPHDKRLCGHACLAMLTDRKLSTVEKEIWSDGVDTKDLRSFLKKRGYKVAPRFRRYAKDQKMPPKAICQIGYYYFNYHTQKFTHDNGGTHLVLWAKNRIWDPWDGRIKTLARAQEGIGLKGKITSYLEIK